MSVMGEYNPTYRAKSAVARDTQRYTANAQNQAAPADEKWPVWVRLLIIVGMSAALWFVIISAFSAIF